MIRQIRRLTRSLETSSGVAKAIGVYMTHLGDVWCLKDANDTGYEGVACVDDAARAALLFLEAGRRFSLSPAIAEARGYLDFILGMQQPDGRFANFILRWTGEPNLTGPTSSPAGISWNARALRALALAVAVTGEQRYRDVYERAFDSITHDERYGDTRALHVLAALELYGVEADAEIRQCIVEWCDQISALRDRSGVLLNYGNEGHPHLWGYVQPAALAYAGAALKRGDWITAAKEAADRYLVPLVRDSFQHEPVVLPYEVGAVVFDFQALSAVTGEARYWDALYLSRAWFRGRNAARAPIYDAIRGFVGDGLDGNRVSANSGAESNIEGALALMDELPWELYYRDSTAP